MAEKVIVTAPDGFTWELDPEQVKQNLAAGYYQPDGGKPWLINGVPRGGSTPSGQPKATSEPLKGPWERLAAKTRANDRIPLVREVDGREDFRTASGPGEAGNLGYDGWKRYDPSLGTVAMTKGAQGLSAGFYDEVKGAVKAPYRALFDNPQGKGLVDLYAEERDRERRKQESVGVAAPKASFVSEAVGGAGGAALGGWLARLLKVGGAGAAGQGVAGAPTAARTGAVMARQGAGYGALSGFGNAQGDLADQAKSTLAGGALGGVVGGVTGAVGNRVMSTPGTFKAPEYSPTSPSTWLNPESLLKRAGADRASSLRASPNALEVMGGQVAPGRPAAEGLEAWGRYMNSADSLIPQQPTGLLARLNQRRPAPLLGPDDSAPSLDRVLTAAGNKSARDISRIEAPLADVPVPWAPIASDVRSGPISSLLSNKTGQALDPSSVGAARSVEDAVVGRVTPDPVVSSVRQRLVVTERPKTNAELPWSHTDPLVRQVPPPRDPLMLPGQTGPSPVINESVPNPGFSPSRAASPVTNDSWKPGVSLLDRPVTNPAYGETTKIVPPVRFSPATDLTAIETRALPVGATGGQATLFTPKSTVPGTTPFSTVMRTAREARDLSTQKGAEYGVTKAASAKDAASALDQSAGILARRGHEAVAPVLGPQAAADYAAKREFSSMVRRGQDAVKATKAAASAPTSLNSEVKGLTMAQGAEAAGLGGLGTLAAARIGRLLGRDAGAYSRSAANKTRLAERLLGDARTHSGNVGGALLRGVRGTPHALSVGSSIAAGDVAAKDMDSPNGVTQAQINALLRWLAENNQENKP